jgi:hypothetical protein
VHHDDGHELPRLSGVIFTGDPSGFTSGSAPNAGARITPAHWMSAGSAAALGATTAIGRSARTVT